MLGVVRCSPSCVPATLYVRSIVRFQGEPLAGGCVWPKAGWLHGGSMVRGLSYVKESGAGRERNDLH